MSKKLIQLISAGARKHRVSAPTSTKVSYFCSKSNPFGNLQKYTSNFFREAIGKRGEDDELIQALESEISYEQSNSKHHRSYDREDIAITALLGPFLGEPGIYPHSVLMKLCITKPGEASILRFDCGLEGRGNDPIIHKVSYHDSALSLHPSKYCGPTYRCFFI
ncbi:uncharacterized protein LOC131035898 isoform X2 [Cryptomeria japonica]|uniref:uncharacterized protein LOC131035898 isoform X2 n=1 Tax=Cryptomeria japonica TaxID=3369 RepID=UPI0027DAAABE|nr:uncharacterized protein LOC131035898 isoform X2 [Cryptomeria japonica]